MTRPILVATSFDTSGDKFEVSYKLDKAWPADSRCYIVIEANTNDLSLDPAMLKALIDHLTSIWQELTRDRS